MELCDFSRDRVLSDHKGGHNSDSVYVFFRLPTPLAGSGEMRVDHHRPSATEVGHTIAIFE